MPGQPAGFGNIKGTTMKGFDSRWTDLPDYILGITKEIW